VLGGELLPISINHPAYDRVMYNPNAVRVGNANWAIKVTSLIDPVYTGHFAIPIERKKTSPGWSQFLRGVMRDYCCYAGSDLWTISNNTGKANGYIRNIG
jgi:hypothetical protein